MTFDILSPAAPLVSAPSDSVLPRCLAYTPQHVRRADGSYGHRGVHAGDIMSCGSALELALVLQMESCVGLRRIVTRSHALEDGRDVFGRVWRRLKEAGLAPTFLVEVEVGGREMAQAVTAMSSVEALTIDRPLLRTAFRDCGMAWTLLTEEWVDWTRAATLLFLGECRRSRTDVRTRRAVLRAAEAAQRGDTLADVLIEASLDAGVQPGVAMRAYGSLAATGDVPADLSGGLIRTDRPLGAANDPDDHVQDALAVADAWRAAFLDETRPRVWA